MRRIKTRTPSKEEFEAIILSMGCDIVEVRECGDDVRYMMNLAGHLVEVPASSWWNIRETVQEEA